eukprot:720348-Amphidinium_carterae.1
MANHITGMTRLALSLRQSTMMALFRKALVEVVATRVVVKRGVLTPDALNYKKKMIKLFVENTADCTVTQLLLWTILTGDWRKADCIEYLVCPDAKLPAQVEVIQLVTQTLLKVLSSCMPPIYPRHRWTGADKAVKWVGLWDAVHSLLHPVYKKFLQLVHHSTSSSEIPMSSSGHEPHVLNAEGLEAADAQTEIVQSSHVHGLDEQSSASFAERNSRDRALAWQWVDQRPFADVWLITILLEHLSELLHAQLELSGLEWERKQRAKLAEAIFEGRDTANARTFRLVVAGKGSLESRFQDQMKALCKSESSWRHFPLSAMNMEFRSKAFRLISRASAGVFQLLSVPHKAYPYRVFQLLSDASLKSVLAREPSCLRDQFSQMLLDAYPGYEGEEVLQLLYCIATCQHTDIAPIEARHSTVRRHMQARVQTWRLNICSASAEFLFQNFRRSLAVVASKKGATKWKQQKVFWSKAKLQTTLPVLESGHGLKANISPTI